MLAGLDVETTPEALISNDFTLHCISVVFDGGSVRTFTNAEDFANQVELNQHTFVMHNAKFDRRILQQCGVDLPHWEDSLLLSYDYKAVPKLPTGANGSPHSLETWGLRLGYEKGDHDDFTQYSEAMRQYCERDAELSLQVWNYLTQRVDQATLDYYYNVEKPFQDVIMLMEANGYLLDRDKLEEAKQELATRCDLLACEMADKVNQLIPSTSVKYKNRHYEKERAGTHQYRGQWEHTDGQVYHWYWRMKEFNPASVHHKRYVIEEIFGAELERNEKGSPKTGDDELEKLEGEGELGEFISRLREYNEKAKLLHTFVESMLFNTSSDGRIRANYNQAVTRTGRLSSSEPNLQNLPSKGDGGKLIRESIVAEEGNKIVCADVSQFQYRIAVYLLAQAFGVTREDVRHLVEVYTEGNHGGDIHEGNRQLLAQYAPDLFNSDDGRKKAKTFGFALLFGAGPNKIAQTSPLTLEEAKTVVQAGKEQIASFEELKDLYIQKCKANEGTIRDIYGRKLDYPGIVSNDEQERARNERQLFNAVVQGSEATIIKLMGIEIARRLPSEARFCGIVHDEFIIEAPEGVVSQVEQMLESILSADWLPGIDGKPGIPCKGDAAHADNWKDSKED